MQTAEGLTARLEICVARMGGKRALAAASGVSEAQLYRYITDGSAVPAERLLALADAAKVDAGWLLTGLGLPEGGAATDRRPPFRPALLTQITQVFEELLLEYDKLFTPRQRAHALAFIYEALRHEEMRRNETLTIDRTLAMFFLDYLSPLKSDNRLEILHGAIAGLEYGEAMSPQMVATFDTLIRQAMISTFEGAGSESYFDRMGLSLSAEAGKRLLELVEKACTLTGRSTLDWLDLGCGNGRHLAFLHAHCPNVRGHGVDASSRALALCAQLVKAGKLAAGTVEPGDFRNIPSVGGSMDVVFCRMGVHLTPYIAEREVGARLLAAEAARVLRPKGLMMTIGHFGQGRDYLPFIQYYNEASFRQLMEGVGLKILSFETTTAASDNGGVRGTDYSAKFEQVFVALAQKV